MRAQRNPRAHTHPKSPFYKNPVTALHFTAPSENFLFLRSRGLHFHISRSRGRKHAHVAAADRYSGNSHQHSRLRLIRCKPTGNSRNGVRTNVSFVVLSVICSSRIGPTAVRFRIYPSHWLRRRLLSIQPLIGKSLARNLQFP